MEPLVPLYKVYWTSASREVISVLRCFRYPWCTQNTLSQGPWRLLSTSWSPLECLADTSINQITLGESPVNNLPSHPASQSFLHTDQLCYPGSPLCLAEKNLIQFFPSLGIKHQARAVSQIQQQCGSSGSTAVLSLPANPWLRQQWRWGSSSAGMGWEEWFKTHSLFWGTHYLVLWPWKTPKCVNYKITTLHVGIHDYKDTPTRFPCPKVRAGAFWQPYIKSIHWKKYHINPTLLQTGPAPAEPPTALHYLPGTEILPRYISLCTTQKWLNHFKSHSGVRMPQSTASGLLCLSNVPLLGPKHTLCQTTSSTSAALAAWPGHTLQPIPWACFMEDKPRNSVCVFDITFQRGDVPKTLTQHKFGRCWTSSHPSPQEWAGRES